MADYKVVRVSDVPDQAPHLGADPEDFEIRFLRNDLGCEHCGVSYARYGKDWRPTRGHRHKRQEEIYLLVSGRAQCKVEDDIVDLEPWTAIRVPPHEARLLRATGDEDAVFVKIGAPNTGPGDGEFVEDFWAA
jgi:mannose-6-phosphate isomerase-like protein (cupin superfamily)